MTDYRIALRSVSDGGGKASGANVGEELDDIVVNDVSMFRMEQMDDRVWWACCYLAGCDERIVFNITYRKGQIIVTANEHPDVVYEGG